MQTGHLLAIIGAVLAMLGGGLGSAIGVSRAGRAASGAMSENPSLFTKLLVIVALPGSQGIYSLAIGAIVVMKIGLLGGNLVDVTTMQGWIMLAGCLPMCIGGFYSAIQQSRSATAAIAMVAKQPETRGKAMLLVALVELYALFSLAFSFLVVFFVV